MSIELRQTYLIKKFQTADTVGELLEIYSYIPEGFEPDYSKFDFRDNPNIDPAWLANQPTPPPYAELTLGSRGQEEPSRVRGRPGSGGQRHQQEGPGESQGSH